jgi:hypothetical protein
VYLSLLQNNPNALSLINDARANLFNAQYFPAAYELAVLRSGNISTATVEQAAIQRGYIEGYQAAILDLIGFEDRVQVVKKAGEAVRDYGALDALLSAKQITQEEYEHLRTKRLSNR